VERNQQKAMRKVGMSGSEDAIAERMLSRTYRQAQWFLSGVCSWRNTSPLIGEPNLGEKVCGRWWWWRMKMTTMTILHHAVPLVLYTFHEDLLKLPTSSCFWYY